MEIVFLQELVTKIEALSLFPNLLNYGPFAPFILRLALGVHLFYSAKQKWRDGKLFGKTVYRKIFAILFLVAGALVIIGLLTQAAALFAAFFAAIAIFQKERRRENYLVLAIALVLLVLGAGPLAIDLPI
jgi:uncharacterized membrane protein YphA (DoxX/SURF4 family)